MKADEELIDEAFEQTKGNPTARQRLLGLIEEYRRACELASGPCEDRSQAWKQKAYGFQARIREIAGENKAEKLPRRPVEKDCC